jgi:V8-like Glu-specific endopeptidase
MVDDDKARRYLDSIGHGAALESATEAAAASVVPESVGTEQQRDEARRAVTKLSRRESLERHERFALEAIVIPDKRPAVLIEAGTYQVEHTLWLHLNEAPAKATLCPTFSSIGRIELPGHPSLPFGGTGFVVGKNLLMTNRHVAEIFSSGLGTHINFRAGLKAGVDFKQERNSKPGDAARIDVRRVAMIHPYWDMALLEVDGFDSSHAPLKLSVRAPEDYFAGGARSAEVAVVGYPAFDSRNKADVQNEVFGGVFNVKRLQPGLLKPRARIDSFDKDVDAITHDASTLGGNSGSAVIHIESGQIVALHFAGRYLEANYAVPTADLARDSRVVDAGVNFEPAAKGGSDIYKQWWSLADEAVTPKKVDNSVAPSMATQNERGGAVTVTIPLQISLALGDPVAAEPLRNATRAEVPAGSDPASASPAIPVVAQRDAHALAEGPLTFRDHFLSLYQSIAEDVARKATKTEGPARQIDAATMLAAECIAATRYSGYTEVPAERSTFESLTPFEYAERCASLAMQMLQAKLSGDAATLARLKGEMDSGKCDPGWATTIEEYVKYFGPTGTRAQPIYVTPAKAGEKALPIKAGCRVGLIGDWGTGAAPARRLLGLVKAQKPDVLIHLGDIYYSGTPEECATKFEAEMTAAFGPKETRIPIYTLAGNHDMYCGGVGYYGLIQRLNRAPSTQEASFFCLRGEDASWQILAMDTGRHDYSPLGVEDVVTFVEADEQAWLQRRIAEFNGRTILMSHHQLFSAYSRIGPKDRRGRANPVNPQLLDMFTGFGEPRERIAAWFWGHEHNLCIYERYVGLARGRCLGHSAVPVFIEDDPYETLEGLRNPPKIVAATEVSHDGSYYRHGFAMLTLNAGGAGTAEYFEDREGIATRTYTETL